MRKWSIAALMGVALLATTQFNQRVTAQARPPNAFAQTTARLLSRNFNRPDVNYLLLDVRESVFIAQNWPDPDQAVPIGSLVKPFTGLAYAEGHAYKFPEHTCVGADTCWLPRGHGHLDVVRATAFSCNSYFTQIASEISSAQVVSVARRFGLNEPALTATPAEMIGRHGAWRESPRAIALAYAELLRRRTQPGVRELVEGMAGAARDGTASAIAHEAPGVAALAKTGTAPCTHSDHAPGDGWVVVAWPADQPQYLLLVRQHGRPGALASAMAGRMLRQLESRP